MSSPPRKTRFRVHRWYRYSVRALLVLIFVISLPLGWIGRDYFRAQREQEVVDLIYRHGGRVLYDHQFQDGHFVYDATPRGNPTLRQWLGDHLYARVVVVSVPPQGADEVVPRLAGLADLREVRLASFRLSDRSVDALASLGRLRGIMLHGTRLSPDQMQRLASTTNLEWIELHGNVFTDDHLAGLFAASRLEKVKLVRVAATDGGIRHLAKIESLQDVRLHQLAGVAEAGYRPLARLPNLSKLLIMQMKATDRSLSDIGQIGSLTHLTIRNEPSDAGITDDGTMHLAELTRLQHLTLAQFPLHDQSLQAIAKLKQLRTLDLAGSKITDAAIPQISSLPHLHYLDIHGTRVTAASLPRLGEVLSLEFLEVSLEHGISPIGLAEIQFASISTDNRLFQRQMPSYPY